jgi:tetratricopeptide (TPR) repeat protein
VGDRDGEALALSNIGFIYDALGQMKQALEYLNQSLSIMREIGNRKGEATTLDVIGTAYRDLEALRQAQLALLHQSSAEAAPASDRGFTIEREKTAPPHQAGYSHPFYWAPFVLIGNYE